MHSVIPFAMLHLTEISCYKFKGLITIFILNYNAVFWKVTVLLKVNLLIYFSHTFAEDRCTTRMERACIQTEASLFMQS